MLNTCQIISNTFLTWTRNVPFSRGRNAHELEKKCFLSPVPHLLCSNGPPTVAEVILIQQAISNAELVINRQDSDLKRGSTVDDSELEVLQATVFIAAHQALLSSPIRSLPSELLELIFTHIYTQNSEKLCHLYHIPAVSQVCRKWRDVALSTPSMWCDITLEPQALRLPPVVPRWKWRKPSECLVPLDLRIDRTRQHPLRVHISVSEVEHTTHPQFLKLLATSDRWTAVTIMSLSFPSAIGKTLQHLHGRVSSLVALELATNFIEEHYGVEYTAFADAPALREVSLRGFWNGERFFFPWSQLTRYKDMDGTSLDPPSLLLMKSSIRELDVFWRSNPAMAPNQSTSAAFPHLEKLKVRYGGPSLFGMLIAPELREMTLEAYGGSEIREVVVMLTRSCPPPNAGEPQVHRNMKSFTYHGGASFSTPDLASFLSLVPCLQHLDIDLPEPADLQKLSILDPQKTLVPNLSSLRFRISTSLRDCDHIRTLAANRCEQPPDQDDGILAPQLQPSISTSIRDHSAHPIKSFTIEFSYGYQIIQERELLECDDFHLEGSPTCIWLQSCNRQLLSPLQLPKGRVKLMEAILAQAKVVDTVFSSIEQWGGSMDAQDLYVSSVSIS